MAIRGLQAAVFVGALAALAACGDDTTQKTTDAGFDAILGSDGTGTTTNPTDTTSVGTGGVSPITGVNTSVPYTTPTPNAGCDPTEVDHGTYGAVYPWGGYTHWDTGHTRFTCNQCPGGRAAIQGRYQLIGRGDGGEGEFDPDFPLASDEIESLYVDGNTFYVHWRDTRNGDEYEWRGYYFCSQKPENPKERIVWVPTEVVQAGPSDNQVVVGKGDVSDPQLTSQEISGAAYLFYFDDGALIGGTGVGYEYCRWGTEIDVGGVTKLCRDRFAD